MNSAGNATIKIFTDGICEPNPDGLACWGFIAFDGCGRALERRCGVVGYGDGMTNQRAAYAAVIAALEWLADEAPLTLAVLYTDSQLLVNQVRGEWACHTPQLQAQRARVLELLQQTAAEVRAVSRAHSAPAEALARKAYGAEARARRERSYHDAT